MNTFWMSIAILRVASLVAPREERAQWLEEWRSELWYIPRPRVILFCLGAFRDAYWVRRNNPRRAKEKQIHLASPLGCLAFLGILSAVSFAVAMWLPALELGLWEPAVRMRDLPMACLAMLSLSILALPGVLLAIPNARTDFGRIGWRARLRRAGFLLLKIALLQPTLLCLFLFWIALPPFTLFAPYLLCAAWIVALRWIFSDQRRRCPVCLRKFTDSIRIGSPARTFLEPYGDGSICPCGHGLLQAEGTSGTFSERSRWLSLDGPLGRLI